MVTRREVLVATAATLAVAKTGWSTERAGGGGLCDHVDPFIGTGGHGHTFPGATVPFGMVQLSPTTDNSRWDACSGYHRDDRTMLGFSHNHLSGTGVGDMFDVLVAPRTGPVLLDPGTIGDSSGSYRQHFDHADERASPGYYRTLLKESGVEAELTATDRVGLHRYLFPAGARNPHLLIDLHYAMKDAGITDASIRVVAPDLIVGSRRVHSWADGRIIHFAMKLSRPCAGVGLYSNGRHLPAGASAVAGADLKAALFFPDAATAPLLVKVALSGVDVDGAIRNLEAELPAWDFDAVHAAARARWERELARVRIDGASNMQARIFYTAYYHTMMAPTLFSDVDGRYRGMDTAVHNLPKDQENYSTFSLWDTYRALHPFFSLVQPSRNADFVSCLIRMTAESPAGPPVWPLQGIETGCMIGWHSAVVIAESYAKGIKGPDYAAAWPLFRKRAFDDKQLGLADYRKLGFIPCDREEESASKTLEYAYDDWAMATLADAAGAHDDAAKLRARSRNYANLFDARLGFIRPRLANGQWAEPYDPKGIGHDWHKWRDFTESNSWEATFLNQHDLHQYMEMFGGDAAFEAKLDRLFVVTGMGEGAPPDIAGLVGQYAHGNEPSHHVAYLYAYTGAHHKTQARVRMLLDTMYRDQPDGLAGNEDCGQMSAWYLMSAMGLYPVDPVSGNYVFGSPLFPRVAIDLENGKTLEIEARDASPDNFYIQSVRWDGKPWTKSWIGHADLAKGGRLIFKMGPKADPRFGADKADRPPSFV